MKKLMIGMMVVCSLMAVSGAAWCRDNDNGTVTVNGLVWLKDAGCLGRMNWNSAMSRVKSLAHGQCDLSDNSKPGDWRLPNLDELKRINSEKSQFKNVQANLYWSSSTYAGDSTFAWGVVMLGGGVINGNKGYDFYVWPVRVGQ